MPKWDPASAAAREFSKFPSDQTNFYAKSLLPLDKKPYQEKAFRRTTAYGWQFAPTVGSII